MISKAKAFVVSLVVLVSAFSAQAVAAAQPVKVFLNGTEIAYDVPPQIVAERTMVPLSFTIQAITGSLAEWDGETKTVTFQVDGHTNVHKIGETAVYVDGVAKKFDTPSLIIDSRTLVPVRMIAETSGCDVRWDAENKYVIITKNEQTAPVAAQSRIISVTPSKTSIRKGESTTLTIKTNAAANNVWANYDDISKNASLVSTASDGTKTWTVDCSPSESQRIYMFANTVRNEETAVMEIQFIEVTEAKATSSEDDETKQPAIFTISANKTVLASGDTVTLDISTNANVNYVWAEYDGAYKNAQYKSSFAGSEKRWTVTIAPEKTQHVRVYANVSSRTTTGAAVITQDVTVTKPTSPKITSVSANITTIEHGSSATLTIKTNSAVQYVWVVCDGANIYANYQSVSGDVKTWTASISPTESQRVYIYANTSTSQSGAASEIQQINVSGAEQPIILDYFVDNATVNKGDSFTFEILTTPNINYVWVVVDGNKLYGDNYSFDDNANMYWQLTSYPETTQGIRVYANYVDSTAGAAMETINVTVIDN